MKTSFTDFKLSFGIHEDENDTEYASIMRGVLRELYTSFGIALVRDFEPFSEEATLEHNIETNLIHKNIKSLSIDTYTEGTDYIVNYSEGTITSLDTGAIPNNTLITVNYEYYVFINESNEVKLEIYPRQNKTIYNIGLNPYTINKVTYLGNTLTEDVDYYQYNGKFELPLLQTNYRKPYILELNVGFDTVPEDLKMAFYELIKLRYDRRKAKADIISRVQDQDGSETTYRDAELPKHLSNIFYTYSGRSLATI